MAKKKVDKIMEEFETNRIALEFVNYLIEKNLAKYVSLVEVRTSLEKCREYINKQ